MNDIITYLSANIFDNSKNLRFKQIAQSLKPVVSGSHIFREYFLLTKPNSFAKYFAKSLDFWLLIPVSKYNQEKLLGLSTFTNRFLSSNSFLVSNDDSTFNKYLLKTPEIN